MLLGDRSERDILSSVPLHKWQSHSADTTPLQKVIILVYIFHFDLMVEINQSLLKSLKFQISALNINKELLKVLPQK